MPADGKAIRAGTASTLFPVRFASNATPGSNRQQYAVSADGQRFLVNATTGEQSSTPNTLILYWKRPQ
jgi:hypothetical protein